MHTPCMLTCDTMYGEHHTWMCRPRASTRGEDGWWQKTPLLPPAHWLQHWVVVVASRWPPRREPIRARREKAENPMGHVHMTLIR